MIPACDHTGTPLHFHSSTTSGSACLMRIRTRASVSPRQSPSSLILASISREGESPPCPSFEPLFLFFMVVVAFFMISRWPLRSLLSDGASPPAPLGGIRQHEQVQTGQQQQGEREQRRVRHPGRRRPSPLCNDEEVGDDGQRKGKGQPAVGLPNRFVPVHWDLL